MYRVSVLLVVLYVITISIAAQNPSAPAATPQGERPRLKDLNAPTDARPPVLKDNTTIKPQTTASPGKADDEVIKITTDLVTTPVSVLDRQGRFIPNL